MFLSLYRSPNTTVFYNFEVGNTFRPFEFNDSDNTTPGTNKDIPVEKFLPKNIEIRFTWTRETTLVHKQYQFINRLITDSGSTTTNDYLDRCIQIRLGSICQWSKSRWCLKQYGKTQHINILTLKVIYLTLLTFTRQTKNNSPPDRQYISPEISSEDGVDLGTQKL